MASGAAMLAPGLVLERKYKITRHLADGGMGAIYEAEHLTIGRRVAVKVLHHEFARKDDIVARFQQEARAASAIGHQNIVDILDLGRSESGAHFIVMELLVGANLGERLAQLGGRMPLARAAHVMRQVLEALAAAHRHGIVHRDLKPENIFLIQRGQDPDFVKVLDFGISKVLTDELPQLSTTGQVLGTPYFMAPEQTRGAVTDHRVDIYACGAILYQLVTGRLPFTAPNFNALMFEIAGGRYYPPRSLAPDIPAAFETVVQYAMALDPNYRFQSAEHMAQSVAPFAQPFASTGAPAAAVAPAGPQRTTGARAVIAPALAQSGTRPLPAAVTKYERWRLPIAVGVGVVLGLLAGLLVVRRMDRAGAGEPAVEQPPARASAPAPRAAEVGGAPVATPLALPDAGVAPGIDIEMAPEPIAKTPRPAPAPATEPAPALPAEATLTIQVIPPDAPGLVIVVDGTPVSSGAITLPASASKKVKLVVRAKGYDDWVRRVSIDHDATIEVKLTRKSLGDKGPGDALGL